MKKITLGNGREIIVADLIPLANQIICYSISKNDMLSLFNDLVPENLKHVVLTEAIKDLETGEFGPEYIVDQRDNQKLFSATIVPEEDGSYYVNFELASIPTDDSSITQEIIDKAAAYDILMGRSEGS